MSTLKHYDFCSGPMDYKSVTDLPGIGPTYGGRLNMAGYYTAKDIYEKFKSLNFDSGSCHMWLYSVCSMNSRYAGMCYHALNEWHRQFGTKSNSPKHQNNQMYRNETIHLKSHDRNLNTPIQTSPATNVGSDINKTEVMQMLAKLKENQDAMASRITDLEQDKSRSDKYIKSLETKIETMNKKAVELRKSQEEKIKKLTDKLSDMDLIEKYANISSSIYLLNQKFDDILTEFTKMKQITTIHKYVNALEANIKQFKTNISELQKHQDDKFSTLTNKIDAVNIYMERNKQLFNIKTFDQTIDELLQQKGQQTLDKIASRLNSQNSKIKKMEIELCNLSLDMQNSKQKNNETKDERIKNYKLMGTAGKTNEYTNRIQSKDQEIEKDLSAVHCSNEKVLRKVKV